jgi:hypothetical protein
MERKRMTQSLTLSNYFGLNRRFSRSINIERDLDAVEAVQGYVLIDESVKSLKAILGDILQKGNTFAWTLTGNYGTGKSAFVQFLTSICAPEESKVKQAATLAISAKQHALLSQSNADGIDLKLADIPKQGFFRAVATAHQEPLSHTILRALENGAKSFWGNSYKKIAVFRELQKLMPLLGDDKPINTRKILELLGKFAKAAKTNILLVIDELGKNLEFAAYYQSVNDLYLLQQLSETPKGTDHYVYFIGLLHHAFSDYGQRLVQKERNEWNKIQGRFENLQFKPSDEQIRHLIAQAIDSSQATVFQSEVDRWSETWSEELSTIPGMNNVPNLRFEQTYPLHPIAALVLPTLCIRYAQNGRSLFTFLTSSEPYSFRQFLQSTECPAELVTVGKKKRRFNQAIELPTLTIDRVYDYFVEAVGMGMAFGSNLQRWLEVQERIADAKHLDEDSLRVLKAIGTLNLFSTGGLVRASRSLVTLALCNDADNLDEQHHWQTVIDQLVEKNLLDELKTLDELRTWAGSDFDIETEITAHIAKEQLLPLSKILAIAHPLKPLIAQRHSYETGTLRCFEQRYLDCTHDLTKLACDRPDADGLVGYWVDETPLSQAISQIPTETIDGKPLILLVGTNLDVLRIRAVEQAALQTMLETIAQLQTDKVARRAVQQRLVQVGKLLQGTLHRAFDITSSQVVCWVQGDRRKMQHITAFNAMLSEICDEVYSIQLGGERSQFVLWNELINRRELTSQGAKARRELITAMLERSDQEQLGLVGNGPEVSIYASVLEKTGIHRRNQEGVFGFDRPNQPGVLVAWDAIAAFCKEATTQRQSIDQLYKRLDAPPYGIKQGVIPVLLAAVLLHYSDEVGVYRDGTFLPTLNPEHFELLIKDPSRFAVRYFDLSGSRIPVFKELEQILKHPNATTLAVSAKQHASGLRNLTLLSVIRPLLLFVRKLPAYTLKTEALSDRAKAVLNAVQTVSEPDELLFTALPQACDLAPIQVTAIEEPKASQAKVAKELRERLTEIIQELRDAYRKLLEECEGSIRQEFMPSSSQIDLRKHLEVWAGGLLGQCLEPTLRSFIEAAADEIASERDWLEGVIMVVADKPPAVWTDDDRVRFQRKLSELAQRFKKLLAIQTEVMTKTVKPFEARQVSVAAQDGQQTVYTVVTIDPDQRSQLKKQLDAMRNILDTCMNPQEQQALLTFLTEEYMGEATYDELEAERTAKRSAAKATRKAK